jgi:hypothetical protein
MTRILSKLIKNIRDIRIFVIKVWLLGKKCTEANQRIAVNTLTIWKSGLSAWVVTIAPISHSILTADHPDFRHLLSSNPTHWHRAGRAVSQAVTSSCVGCRSPRAQCKADFVTNSKNRPRQGSSRENRAVASNSAFSPTTTRLSTAGANQAGIARRRIPKSLSSIR